MTRSDEILRAHPPTLVERRGDRTLFVWGPLGQWLVLDADAATLIKQFRRRRRVGDVIEQYARQRGRSSEDAAAEILPVVDALVQRGILSQRFSAARPPAEPLRIANLTFNITNRCNLRCPWCYNAATGSEEVPVTEWIAWLGAGAAALAPDASLLILGGEPMLDEDRLLETVAGARRQFGGEILISTNGTRLGPDTPAALAAFDVTVQVSIDGPSAAIHDAVRGRGVFGRAVASARRLVEAGVRTIFSMVMSRGSQEHFEAYFDLARQVGVHEVRFIPLRRIGHGIVQSDRVPDLYDCFRSLVGLLKRRPELVRLVARDFFSILMIACRFSRLRDNCGIGRQSLLVDADGSIYPCPNFRAPEDRCGSVRDKPLASLMEASPVLACFRERYRLARMPQCADCAFSHWCAGDCRAEALAVSGDAQAPSPYCEDLRRILPEMLWLIADGWEGIGGRPQALRPWT